MKKSIILAVTSLIALCLFTFCAKENNRNEKEDNAPTGGHTYKIEIVGGKTYQGGVPKEVTGTYNPVAFVTLSEETGDKVLAGMLSETGKFQFGIGVALDGSNQPILPENGVGITFGEWGTEDKYGPAGPVNMTLKNYKEQTISLYGEEGTIASYTLTFSGKFRLGSSGKTVDVTGEVRVAAP
jgi:hypothetical protein